MFSRNKLRSVSQRISLTAISCTALLGGLIAKDTHANAANIPISDCVTGAPVTIGSSVTIRKINIDNQNIFDLDNPDENNVLFKTANMLHIQTRKNVIRQRMLIQPGDNYSLRLVRETERIARAAPFIYDDYICVRKLEDDQVDLELVTRDVWTLRPGISAGRKGGKNSASFGIEEKNLFGTGVEISVGYSSDVDRDTTLFTLKDRNILNTWISGNLTVGSSSDGNTLGLSLSEPFYSLDTKHAWQLQYLDDERKEFIYDRGEIADEFQREQSYQRATYGWSNGLKNGWARRFTVGAVRDINTFSQLDSSAISTLIPEDREFQYPFIGFELVEDHFELARDRDQMGRTEDFYLGTGFSASLGLLSESLGSDRDGLILQSSWNYSLSSGEKTRWLLDGNLSGRWENTKGLENARIGARLRYYYRQSPKRLLFISLAGTLGEDLDLDNLLELGGDSGLRGYPLRYQTGDKRALMTVEQRYFTSWYPFRLFYVGAAAFFDIGRTWGNNPVGQGNIGLLKDIGVGLRLASSRSSTGTMIHIDFAMPLDGDSDISNLQINIAAKKGF